MSLIRRLTAAPFGDLITSYSHNNDLNCCSLWKISEEFHNQRDLWENWDQQISQCTASIWVLTRKHLLSVPQWDTTLPLLNWDQEEWRLRKPGKWQNITNADRSWMPLRTSLGFKCNVSLGHPFFRVLGLQEAKLLLLYKLESRKLFLFLLLNKSNVIPNSITVDSYPSEERPWPKA